ncbi:hypothetical protein DPMN_071557 [Dreissena polymorpha]|uniref:Uncharacterized protein n=1 Tax=Dreissena polymorpha TaxID=45954 RepID=A0A9D3Z7R0_DREPO|nr:hypothetical protein DPMN_071557 [Dreissena polymorpha]
MVQDGSIGFPDPQPFPNDTVEMPYFLVGDDAFSFSENMQNPLDMSPDKRRKNPELPVIQG